MGSIATKVAQAVFDAILNTPYDSLNNKIKTRLLMQCRQQFVHFADPLVVYTLDGSQIMLPLSHNLPFIRKKYPHYSSNLARIAKHVAAKYDNLTFLDIGANIGDTVAILRNLAHFPILCVEGNVEFLSILKKNLAHFTDVFFEDAFVSDQENTISGKFDSLNGTAHFVENQSATQAIHARTLSSILEKHPKFKNFKMLKIDTDGYDCRILSCELALIERLRPVIFFEYDPYYFEQYSSNGLDLFADLKGIGYVKALIYENNGDYLLSANLDDEQLLQDIHQFYSGRKSLRYCDISIFHYEDVDLCEAIRATEIEFFVQLRGKEN